MKALVIGHGSIGSRHARLLAAMGHATAVVSRRTIDVPVTFRNITEAIAEWEPDYVVIASRTNEHRDDFAALASAGFTGTLMIEKPLFDSHLQVPEHAFNAVYVAYNLRFHPLLSRFKALLDETQAHAVHAYVGQYLPDWRPGTDYRKSYSANKSQGGGVLRDLSHELDFLNWTLGGWTRLTSLGGNISELEIDSDDIYSVLFETTRCPVVSLQLNYLDTTLRREFLAMTADGSIRADLIGGTIEVGGKTGSFEVAGDETYQAEHRAALSGDPGDLCTLTQGLDAMRMISAIETAVTEQAWITA